MWLRSFSAALPGVRRAHTDDEVRAWFREVVVPGQETWVATVDGSVVAMMTLDGDDLDQLYIDPAWQGRGIGRRLVDVAKERSPSGLTLWTFQVNEPPVASTSGTVSWWRSGPTDCATRSGSRTSGTCGALRERVSEAGCRGQCGSAAVRSTSTSCPEKPSRATPRRVLAVVNAGPMTDAVRRCQAAPRTAPSSLTT